MEFKIGCNYWASDSGTEMWKKYNSDTIRKDFAVLKSNGIDYLRVFPNWRDFQPVSVIYGGGHSLQKYVAEDETEFDNPYCLSGEMLDRFSDFCGIAEEFDIKLIVGLITGWMSGRLFIPPALYERNLYTDPVAQKFEQKFIAGFVSSFRDKKAIYAWDIGNECNCMDCINNRDEADNWTMMITNAIKANDNSRPIVSGMHSLTLTDGWTIQDQAAGTDILTTHPYPFWVNHCAESEITSVQTLLHATCQTKYYANIGKKPCLVEEIGTMGPMVCDEDTAAQFLKVNLYSNWANGAEGVFWWCAHEQINLRFPPYDSNMCETELGLLDENFRAKPVLHEIKRFSDWISTVDFTLPAAQEDGVCLLTNGQDHWGIAYMTYVLSKQAGANISFAYADEELPDTGLYLMPSICGINALSAHRWNQLKQKVYHGATLYISNHDAILSGFQSFAGVRVRDSKTADESGSFMIDGKMMEYRRSRCFEIVSEEAEVLAYDENGLPLMTSAKYGNGKVIYLNYPLEKNLLDRYDAFSEDVYEMYQVLFQKSLEKHALRCDNKNVGVTLHCDGARCYAVLINYSSEEIQLKTAIREDYKMVRLIKGNLETLAAFDTAIVELTENAERGLR